MATDKEKKIVDSKISALLFSASYLVISEDLIGLFGLRGAAVLTALMTKWRYFYDGDKLINGEYIYYHKDKLLKATGVKYNAQTKITTRLQKLGILSIVKDGMPYKNYYKINFDKVAEMVKNGYTKKDIDEELEIVESELSEEKNSIKSSRLNLNDNPLNSKRQPAYFQVYSKRYKDKSLSNDKDYLKEENNFSNEKLGTSRSLSHNSSSYNFKPEVIDIFNYWQNLSIVKHREGKTKLKALSKIQNALQRHKEQKIKRAMDLYKELLIDPYSTLKDKSPWKVGLDQFFGFNDFTKASIKKIPNTNLQYVKSWFDMCTKPKQARFLFIKAKKDKNPVLTKIIQKHWAINYLPSKDPETYKPPPKDVNVFIDCAENLMQWHKAYKKDFNFLGSEDRKPGACVKWIFEFLKTKKNVHIGWLRKDFLFEGMNLFLQQKGYMKK